MFFTVLLFLIVATSMVLCNVLARQRDRDPVFWTVLAAIIGPLAIPFVYFLKKTMP